MELSTGVMSWELRGIGVSVMIGLGSGDLSMGFSSSLSWWIQRSGGLTSLEFPLYLWDPFTDLQAARFLGKENKWNVLRCRLPFTCWKRQIFTQISFRSCIQLSKSYPLGRKLWILHMTTSDISKHILQLWCHEICLKCYHMLQNCALQSFINKSFH